MLRCWYLSLLPLACAQEPIGLDAGPGPSPGATDSGVPIANDAGTCTPNVCAPDDCGNRNDGCGSSIDCGPCAGWQTLTTDGAPSPRASHSAVWTGSEMIIWGGWGPDDSSGGAYDPQTGAWRSLSTDGAPTPRFGHRAVFAQGQMIVFGGTSLETFAPLFDGGRYDLETDQWRPLTPALPEDRRYEMVEMDGRLYLWGAPDAPCYIDAFNDSLFIYDIAQDRWLEQVVLTDLSAYGCGMRLHALGGGQLAVWGGFNGATLGADEPDGATFSLNNLTWRPMSTLGEPALRDRHASVLTSDALLIWGGLGERVGAPISEGARYDPSQDRWTPMTNEGAPSPRINPLAVFTGQALLILFGEGEQRTRPQDGALYDPDSDSWTPLVMEGGLSARDESTIIWTGQEAIVWGGIAQDGVLPLNDGARLILPE